MKIDSKLVSYSKAPKAAGAQKDAELRSFYNAVTKALEESAFRKAIAAQQAAAAQQVAAVAAQQAAAVAANTMPAAWMATAICEEGGRNDPSYGYFGIKEWNGFGGYPTAGSAPLSVQLAWEGTYIGAPPDAPGQCHAY